MPDEGWLRHSFSSGEGGSLLNAQINCGEGFSVRSPVVMMLTGDGPKGTKSLSWVNLPPLLERIGVRSFLVDFEGLGYSSGDRKTLTLSRAVSDLRVAFHYLKESILEPGTSLGAIASSFGASALLMSPNIANSMKAIALKSPAPFLPQAYLNEIGSTEFRNWINSGFSAANGYDRIVLRDAFQHNVYASAASIRTATLITHGTADEIVPFSQSELLAACLSGPVRLVPFENGDHGYSQGGAWDKMAHMYVDWFREGFGPLVD